METRPALSAGLFFARRLPLVRAFGSGRRAAPSPSGARTFRRGPPPMFCSLVPNPCRCVTGYLSACRPCPARSLSAARRSVGWRAGWNPMPPDAVCDPVLMSNGSGGVGAQMPSKYRLTKLAALLALCGLSIFLGRCSSTDHGDHKERCSTVAGGVARVLVGVSGTRRRWCCVG
jgi:hypothetical protein